VFEIGNSLREARYRQHLELAEVEQAIKVRARYLQALEEESFDALPAQTYVKGFLRTYADYLGLDGQLYVDEFNSRYAVGGEEPQEPVVARRSARVHPRHRRLERRGVLLALGGIAIVFALIIAAFRFGGNSNNNSPPIPNLGATGGTTTGKKKTKQTKKHVVKQQPTVQLRFFVVASYGNCWLDVRNYSVNGSQLYQGTLQAHQALSFRTGRLFAGIKVGQRLWIDFGAPHSVQVSVNGQAQQIPGDGRSVLVTRQGLTVAA
jgi:hypothetical protein